MKNEKSLSLLPSAWGSVRGAFLPTVFRFPQAAQNAVIGDHLVTVDSDTDVSGER